MNKLTLSIIIFVTLIILGIFILSKTSIQGANDLKGNPDTTLYANLNETCSTPTIHATCKKGLVCATKQGKINFDTSLEIGYCQDPNKLKKTYVN